MGWAVDPRSGTLLVKRAKLNLGDLNYKRTKIQILTETEKSPKNQILTQNLPIASQIWLEFRIENIAHLNPS